MLFVDFKSGGDPVPSVMKGLEFVKNLIKEPDYENHLAEQAIKFTLAVDYENEIMQKLEKSSKYVSHLL